jgi:eukaryotic-like serine/threonine-protein kinase
VAQQVIGRRYRLDEQLGLGGMAEVWAAQDLELDRRVALKLLGADADPARFEREAHAVASLGHPNVCRLFDYGSTDEGRPYMVLEYLPGGTLEERLRPGEPVADEETARLAREIAAGLAHAHSRRVVHRDLKPSNVLFDAEGTAKIADFGIARVGGAGTLTETGTLLGTAAYISPEQAAGEPAIAASDVYSFGVILFRLLTGRLPFEAETSLELAAKHLRERPPGVRELRPDAPASLAAAADAALAKDPADRPADGVALAEALGVAPTTTTLLPRDEVTQVTQVIRRPLRRPPRAAMIAVPAALLAAAGVGLAVLATRDGTSERHPPTRAVHPTTRGSRASTTTPATGTTRSTTRATTRSTTKPSPPPATAPPPPPPPPPPPATTTPTLPTTTETLPTGTTPPTTATVPTLPGG